MVLYIELGDEGGEAALAVEGRTLEVRAFGSHRLALPIEDQGASDLDDVAVHEHGALADDPAHTDAVTGAAVLEDPA